MDDILARKNAICGDVVDGLAVDMNSLCRERDVLKEIGALAHEPENTDQKPDSGNALQTG